MALGLDVKHPRSLASCIRRAPDLSVKICVKKNASYIRVNTVVLASRAYVNHLDIQSLINHTSVHPIFVGNSLNNILIDLSLYKYSKVKLK